VAIGDVTGKGAEAAATTALVRYTLRAAAQHAGSPSELLAQLNAAMLAQRADYCTIGLLSIQPPQAEVTETTICLAGHSCPIRIGTDGEASPIGAPGTLLGYMAEASFTETRVALAPGETLLLYTDGLTEAAAPPGWSTDELIERLQAHRSETLQDLLARLESEAISEADGHPRDDIALLAVRRAG
jgi:serine phosphatase RsbU (regulator of sigma subunit)